MPGMKMAVASRADIDMALTLTTFLDSISKGYVPDAVSVDAESIEWLDDDNSDQCCRIVKELKAILEHGSLFRVTFGMATVCDPRNKVIDPDADTLELHPDHVRAAAERGQLEKRVNTLERDLAVLKSANRLLGERLLAGRVLVAAPALQPERSAS